MARRRTAVFGLSFLDAITCGFGAVVLFYMIVNASISLHAEEVTRDRRAEVDLLQDEVLEGFKDLVELRNSLEAVEESRVVARGLSRRLLEALEEIEVELATFRESTLATREHVNRLMADLRSMEEAAKRLSAAAPSEETPGDRTRLFVGDGDRQYLTGLKVGGQRIAVLVDASASMLDETIVNIVRRRNMPDSVKLRSEKWQQALSTVDWITTQFPRDSRFQIYTFNEAAGSVLPETTGRWLDASSREVLDGAVQALRKTVPAKGTSLHHGLAALRGLNPAPDNIILLVDGLPTQGERIREAGNVSGKQRLKLYNKALEQLPRGAPVNVILFPMEGDPRAASAYWNLAVSTRGSFLSPSRDWP